MKPNLTPYLNVSSHWCRGLAAPGGARIVRMSSGLTVSGRRLGMGCAALVLALVLIGSPVAVLADEVVVKYSFKGDKRVLVIDENSSPSELATAAKFIGEYGIIPMIVFDGAVEGDTLTAYELMSNIAAQASTIESYDRIVELIGSLIDEGPVIASKAREDKGQYRPLPAEPKKPDETGGGEAEPPSPN